MIDVPPIWLAVAAALVWWTGHLAPIPLGGFGQWAGGLLVAAGLVLIALAAWQFHKHRTSIVPHMVARHLLTDGVFAYSRNPIYLGDALILAGLCLRWDASVALVLVPVFCAFIQWHFIRAEEARLAAEFPESFSKYAINVRRWL